VNDRVGRGRGRGINGSRRKDADISTVGGGESSTVNLDPQSAEAAHVKVSTHESGSGVDPLANPPSDAGGAETSKT